MYAYAVTPRALAKYESIYSTPLSRTFFDRSSPRSPNSSSSSINGNSNRQAGCKAGSKSSSSPSASRCVGYCRASTPSSVRPSREQAPGMAVKVYGWAVSPYVSRALLALEEAGVDYELVPMSRGAGDHRTPDHLARNPFGQVPVLEDGDLTLFESRAIARHVFRKHRPELLGSGSLERAAAVDVWQEAEAQQLHPAAGAVVVECVFAPLLGRARDQAAVDAGVEKLRKVLEVYEARLATHRYLAGDFLSAADLSHFPILHYFMATEYAGVVEEHPHVKAWWEGLATRPAARKVAGFMPLGGAKKQQE